MPVFFASLQAFSGLSFCKSLWCCRWILYLYVSSSKKALISCILLWLFNLTCAWSSLAASILFIIRFRPLYYMHVPEFCPTPGISVTVSFGDAGPAPTGELRDCSYALKLIEVAATCSLYDNLLKLLKSLRNFDSLEGTMLSFYLPLRTSARLTDDWPTSS